RNSRDRRRAQRRHSRGADHRDRRSLAGRAFEREAQRDGGRRRGKSEEGHAFYAVTNMHQHSHAHETTSTSVSRKLVIASIATLILVAAELVAGRIAGSLSLVGDAL